MSMGSSALLFLHCARTATTNVATRTEAGALCSSSCGNDACYPGSRQHSCAVPPYQICGVADLCGCRPLPESQAYLYGVIAANV